ncbi:MAG: protease inhibitor I42 family protein [Acidimicrobiia bacterium]|nr:protease inhibitor I42 family protein [Acidimicrobiia bacterium]
MTNKRTIVIAGLVLIAVVAAGALAAMAMSTDGAGEPQVYTAADDGAAIEVQVGETITVDLSGNPTTGYAWQVEGLDAAVMTATEPAFESDSELMGAGGTFTFTFTAVAAGETQLRLVYLRPWEQVEPLETFTMTITVP